MLVVGASNWVRKVAKQLQLAGFRVLIADTNPMLAGLAVQKGLEIYQGNALSELAEDEINFGGIGRVLAMTSNSEVNALVGEHYQAMFGADSVFELQRPEKGHGRDTLSQHLGGRRLFPRPATFRDLDSRIYLGADIHTVVIEDVQATMKNVPASLLPLFVITDSENLVIRTSEDPPRLQKGNRVVALIESGELGNLIEQKAIKAKKDDAVESESQIEVVPSQG